MWVPRSTHLPDTFSVPLGKPLPLRFYARDSREVAPQLIGCRLVHRLETGERLILRITKVEAANLPYRFFEADATAKGAPSPWVSAFRAGGGKKRRR